jgi:hypothetical protein
VSGANSRGELVESAFGDVGISAERPLGPAATIEAEELRDHGERRSRP